MANREVVARVTGFRIMPGSDASGVILHVPHGSTAIPDDVRAGILLDDDALAAELAHMTDAPTCELAQRAAALAGTRPWQHLNMLSRMVIDPERFPDQREEMNAVGMGAVYERTSHGELLRTPTPAQRQELITRYFDPYAEALATLVSERVTACGAVVILDVHSYPAEPLPYELHADGVRPPVCIGTDPTHTPGWLADAVAHRLRDAVGDVDFNSPFTGTYVPLWAYDARDERVRSVMLEIRRDVAHERFDDLAAATAAAIDDVAAAA